MNATTVFTQKLCKLWQNYSFWTSNPIFVFKLYPSLVFLIIYNSIYFYAQFVNSAKFSTKEYNHVSPNINKNGTTVK